MFNEELKREFIKFRIGNTNIAESFLIFVFNKVGKYEKGVNKDVYSFDYETIGDMFKSFKTPNITTLQTINSQLIAYTDFCIKKGLTEKNYYTYVNANYMKDCLDNNKIMEQFVTREQLILWCDKLPNPRDRFILLALYEGIKGKDYDELIELKESDVSETEFILSSGRKIVPSELLWRTCQLTIDKKTLEIMGDNHRNLYFFDQNDKHILKALLGNKPTNRKSQGRWIHRNIKRALEYAGAPKSINANQILECGIINYINEIAKDYGVTGAEMIYHPDLDKMIEDKFGKKLSKQIISLKYESYLV